jgi:hypothetical protein
MYPAAVAQRKVYPATNRMMRVRFLPAVPLDALAQRIVCAPPKRGDAGSNPASITCTIDTAHQTVPDEQSGPATGLHPADAGFESPVGYRPAVAQAVEQGREAPRIQMRPLSVGPSFLRPMVGQAAVTRRMVVRIHQDGPGAALGAVGPSYAPQAATRQGEPPSSRSGLLRRSQWLTSPT